MPKRKENRIPHVIIEDSAANDLYILLDGMMTGGTHLAQQVFETLKEEGQKFAEEPAGKELKNLVASEFLRDNDKTADFLSRVETTLKREPQLSAAADVITKYLKEMKPLKEILGSRRAPKRSKVLAQERLADSTSDFFYFLLGLFSLARKAMVPTETREIPKEVESQEDTVETDTQKRDIKRNAKIGRARPRRSKSTLLR